MDVATELRFENTPACGPVPTAYPGTTASELRERLPGHRFESAAHVAVVDPRHRLVGLARIEDVLSADSGVPVEHVMDVDPPVIPTGVNEEIAAWKAVRHGESALAVVDDDGRFVGLVPPRQIVEVLLGLLGAVLSAELLDAFGSQLERDVLIAFFVPGVVYMADAIGTQTEAIVIRGLSVGVNIRHVYRRELLTGVLIGLALAAAFLPIGVALWGRGDVAVAVALALFAACSTATIAAMALPWLHRLGHDPAYGAGPLGTVVQDLLSLVIYLVVAALIVG